MSKIKKIAVAIMVASLGYLAQDQWSKKVIDDRLTKHQYSEVFVNKKGGVVVSDPNLTPDNIALYRLPLKYEHKDDRLLEFIKEVEGYGGIDKTKGVIKAMLTTLGLGNYGGGSTIDISVAGSILGNRTPAVCKDNQSVECTAKKVFLRAQEMSVAHQIGRLDQDTQDKLMLSESCLLNNVHGCTLAAAALWGRMPQTDKERIILISSIRYPIRQTNVDRLVAYSTRVCHRLHRLKNKISDLDSDCVFNQSDFEIVSKKQVAYPTVLNQHVKINAPLKLKFEDKIWLVNHLSHQYRTADVEIAINEISGTHPTPVFMASNSPYLIDQGGFKNANIASIAKLVMLLDTEANYGFALINAMGASKNEDIYKLLKNTSAMRLEKQLMLEGLNFKYNNLAYDLSFGYVAGSTADVHALAYTLYHQESGSVVKKALAAAIEQEEGTLHHLKPMTDRLGFQVVIAKSGTHANRTHRSFRSGVYGSLTLVVVKDKNGRTYSITVRMHSHQADQPICEKTACTKTSMTNLTELALQIITNFEK